MRDKTISPTMIQKLIGMFINAPYLPARSCCRPVHSRLSLLPCFLSRDVFPSSRIAGRESRESRERNSCFKVPSRAGPHGCCRSSCPSRGRAGDERHPTVRPRPPASFAGSPQASKATCAKYAPTISSNALSENWSSLMGQILPAPDVSDALFVARHDHLCPLTDSGAVLGARSAGVPGAALRINHFTRSTRTNADA